MPPICFHHAFNRLCFSLAGVFDSCSDIGQPPRDSANTLPDSDLVFELDSHVCLLQRTATGMSTGHCPNNPQNLVECPLAGFLWMLVDWYFCSGMKQQVFLWQGRIRLAHSRFGADARQPSVEAKRALGEQRSAGKSQPLGMPS